MVTRLKAFVQETINTKGDFSIFIIIGYLISGRFSFWRNKKHFNSRPPSRVVEADAVVHSKNPKSFSMLQETPNFLKRSTPSFILLLFPCTFHA